MVGRSIFKPIPVSPEEASRILDRLMAQREPSTTDWRPGDRLRVVEGPFGGFEGTFEEYAFRESALKVRLNISGRPTPVQVEWDDVERLSAK